MVKIDNPDYHHFQDISEEAEKKLTKLLDFLDRNAIYFYSMEELYPPKISEESQGRQRYVNVTVSIKLA